MSVHDVCIEIIRINLGKVQVAMISMPIEVLSPRYQFHSFLPPDAGVEGYMTKLENEPYKGTTANKRRVAGA